MSSKILVLFLLSVFWCSIPLMAQDAPIQAKKVRKGEFTGFTKAGIVASQIYNDDFGGYNKLGGTGGVGVFTPISQNLKIQLELNFAMRGSRRPPDPEKGISEIRYEASYIDIPILLKSTIWKFEYEIGLVNAVNIQSRFQGNGLVLPDGTVAPFNRYELGFNLGIGVPINDNWTLNPRFHYSLTPAIGVLRFVNGLSLAGGAYHNAISFCFVRTFTSR